MILSDRDVKDNQFSQTDSINNLFYFTGIILTMVSNFDVILTFLHFSVIEMAKKWWNFFRESIDGKFYYLTLKYDNQ